MQTIEFTSEELEALRELLEHSQRELDVEVFRTDSPDFKQMLKNRRHTLEQILDKLSATPAHV